VTRRTQLLTALGAFAVLAAGTAAAVVTRSAGRTGTRMASPAAAAPSPAPRPELALATDAAGRVRWNAPLHLTARNATLTGVSATDDLGAPLAGALGPGGAGWTSGSALVPTARYTVTAAYTDADGHSATRVLAATATDASTHLTATLSPGDGNVVGVGQPVIVMLSRAVPPAERPVVQARLQVTTSPAQEGAWRWMSATELHWRPRTYWKTGTHVTASAALDRLPLAGGVWGTGAPTAAFAIGRSRVSIADTAAHTLTVTENGKTVRVLPMSSGNSRFPTRSGVHLTLEKSPSLVFDSSTIGIPSGGAGGYKKTVLWDVRLTYSGTFVHAAPWSVADQGRRNVSHGCLNLSTANAEWFYETTRRGDVVDIRNSGVGPKLSDPGAEDWNIPWSRWSAGT